MSPGEMPDTRQVVFNTEQMQQALYNQAQLLMLAHSNKIVSPSVQEVSAAAAAAAAAAVYVRCSQTRLLYF